jgi:hypothetical protein
MRGPRAAAARREEFATTLVTNGAISSGTRASVAGGRGPRWPLPPGVLDQCSPWSGEPTLLPPVVVAQSRHLLVLDPEGSKQRRPLGWRGSLCPTLALVGAWLMAPEDSLCVVNDQPVGNPKRKV